MVEKNIPLDLEFGCYQWMVGVQTTCNTAHVTDTWTDGSDTVHSWCWWGAGTTE